MFVAVTLSMVCDTIRRVYPQLKYCDRIVGYPDCYAISSHKDGFYVFIKVPNPKIYGKALHVAVRCRYGIKDKLIYPIFRKSKDHFKTNRIPRVTNWRISLLEEIKNGVTIYGASNY